MPVAAPFQAYRLKKDGFFGETKGYSLQTTDLLPSSVAAGELEIESNFIKDKLPAIYVYNQFYTNEVGQPCITKGWIADLEVSNWNENKVLKHEDVDKAGILLQYTLVKKNYFYLQPIHVLYEDASCIDTYMEESILNPIIIFNELGVEHRISAIHDKKVINKFLSTIENKQLIIADGHHRYSAALELKNENLNYRFIPAFFTNVNTNNFSILPFHLQVKVERFDKEYFLKHITQAYKIKGVERSFLETNPPPYNSIRLILKNRAYLLFNINSDSTLPPPDINNVLTDLYSSGTVVIEYTGDIKTCITNIGEGIADIAFIRRPYSVEEVLEVSKQHKILPQKSTCFLPKVPRGLIIQKAGVENASFENNCF